MYRARRVLAFLGWALLAVAVGFTTYLALAGYRQILMACMLTAAVIAVRKGYVSRRMLVPFMITGLVSILALSFLRYAGEQLEQARQAQQGGDLNQARRLLEQSQVNSDLAVAKSRLGRTREAVQVQAAANAQLRGEPGPATPPETP